MNTEVLFYLTRSYVKKRQNATVKEGTRGKVGLCLIVKSNKTGLLVTKEGKTEVKIEYWREYLRARKYRKHTSSRRAWNLNNTRWKYQDTTNQTVRRWITPIKLTDRYGNYYVFSKYNEVVNGPGAQNLKTVLEKKIEHGNIQEQYVKHMYAELLEKLENERIEFERKLNCRKIKIAIGIKCK